MIKSIFSCQIQKEKYFTNRYNSIFINHHPCHKNNTCPDKYVFNNFCDSKSLRVIKTIRVRLIWLLKLLKDESVNFKIVHLVRDPRPVYKSYQKLGWVLSYEDCNAALQDLIVGELIQREYPER